MHWYVALPLLIALGVGHKAFMAAAHILGGPSSSILPTTRADVFEWVAFGCAAAFGAVLANWNMD
jgi:hypothetical protein